MKNSKLLLSELIDAITLNESREEKRAIAAYLIESICGFSASDLMAGKPVVAAHEAQLVDAIRRINLHEPLQYIIHEAHFFGRKFYVDPRVLIPRPETEELISHIIKRIDRNAGNQNVVDVATGSGCIALTLALELPHAITWGTDISAEAISVARINADALGAPGNFVLHNILEEDLPLDNLSLLVSNPPYIAKAEQHTMKRNVLEFEPHLALFVPDNDPLVFYHALAKRGMKSMRPGAIMAVEINERFGRDVAGAMMNAGLRQVEILKDIAGKERFVFARKADS